MKYGSNVLFVHNNKEFAQSNNGNIVAAAIVTAPWNDNLANLKVLGDNTSGASDWKTSIRRAQSKEELLNGGPVFVSQEQLEAFGYTGIVSLQLMTSEAHGEASNGEARR